MPQQDSANTVMAATWPTVAPPFCTRDRLPRSLSAAYVPSALRHCLWTQGQRERAAVEVPHSARGGRNRGVEAPNRRRATLERAPLEAGSAGDSLAIRGEVLAAPSKELIAAVAG